MSSSSSGKERTRGVPSHLFKDLLSSTSESEEYTYEYQYESGTSKVGPRNPTHYKEKPYDADRDLFESESDESVSKLASVSLTDDIDTPSPNITVQERQGKNLQKKLKSMVQKPIQSIRRALNMGEGSSVQEHISKSQPDESKQLETSFTSASDNERSSSSPLGAYPTYPRRAKVKHSTPKKHEVFPVEASHGNYAQCKESGCTKSYTLKSTLVEHMRDKHRYTKKNMPLYVKKMKEAPRKYKCPGCKGIKTRIQEHYARCNAFQKLIKKRESEAENQIDRYSQRWREESFAAEMMLMPSTSTQSLSYSPILPPSQRVPIADAYTYMKQRMKVDTKLKKNSKNIYKSRIKNYFKWLREVAGIHSSEVLNMYSPDYRRLPALEDYISYLRSQGEHLSGAKLSQIASAFQYLCRVLIHWILQNWERLPQIHRADSERYYQGLLTDNRSSLKDYSKQQDREAERNAGENSDRLGASTDKLLALSKELHGDNQVIDEYYEKLYSMKILHARNELTLVQIRDFIMLMIITSGNGSRIDAIQNLTIEEWKKRIHSTTTDNSTICLVNIYEHKTDVDGPVKIIFDERLETVTELYRIHIRPIYAKKHKDPGTLFITYLGTQVQNCRTVKTLLGKLCNINKKDLQEIKLYDFRHAVANWAQQNKDKQVKANIAGAMNHSTAIHEKRYIRDKDAAKAHIYDKYGESIKRKPSACTKAFQEAKDYLEQVPSESSQSPDEQESQIPEDSIDVGSMSRHVIPTYLKCEIFDILRSLKDPPGKTLTDVHINQAFQVGNFEALFTQLQGIAVQARQRRGKFLDTDIEKVKEAKRLLKASWRSAYRDW